MRVIPFLRTSLTFIASVVKQILPLRNLYFIDSIPIHLSTQTTNPTTQKSGPSPQRDAQLHKRLDVPVRPSLTIPIRIYVIVLFKFQINCIDGSWTLKQLSQTQIFASRHISVDYNYDVLNRAMVCPTLRRSRVGYGGGRYATSEAAICRWCG